MNGKNLLNIEILIASSNQGKIKEIKNILKYEKLVSLADKNFTEINVVEDGKTFKENAYKKAKTFALKYNIITIADDSGLEVDALDGKPGVNSARYAGANAKDKDLYTKLLKEMKEASNRKAQFVTVLCLFNPYENKVIYATGICGGLISDEPKGQNGFGYDPIFYLPNLDKTMAELSNIEKNKLSHRSKALENLKNEIYNIYGE